MNDTALMLRPTIGQFIAQYQQYQELMDAMQSGLEQARRARRELEALIHPTRDQWVADWRISDMQKQETQHITNEAWRWLLDQIGVSGLLTEKRQQTLWENMRQGQMPPLTPENVFAFLEAAQSHDFFKEALLEAFDTLRPGRFGHDHYKTNKNAWRIGRKVVLQHMVRPAYDRAGFVVEFISEPRLATVDRAFHLIDAKLEDFHRGYRCPLIDAINSTPGGSGETTYFRFKCFKNGNLHLEFKRPDLLQELNRIGGQGRKELGVQE